MESKIYEYNLKNTSANTDYVNLTKSERTEILQHLRDAMLLMDQLIHEPRSHPQAEEYTRVWLTRTAELNSGRGGLNSPASMMSGVIYNMCWGGQRDFTLKQLADIEKCMALVNDAFPDLVPEIVFEDC